MYMLIVSVWTVTILWMLGCGPYCVYTLPDVSSVPMTDIFSGVGTLITKTDINSDAGRQLQTPISEYKDCSVQSKSKSSVQSTSLMCPDGRSVWANPITVGKMDRRWLMGSLRRAWGHLCHLAGEPISVLRQQR